LRRVAIARAIRASNSIEGYNVTEDDAIAAVEGEEPMEAQTEAWAAVNGYRSAMTYVLGLADDPHFSYSADLLRALHFMMLEYDLRKHPGRWIPGPIYVRYERAGEIIYEGPDAIEVPKLIDKLVAYLNTNDDDNTDLVHAALAHLNLVMIHPFSNGNGRMARCLQTLALARGGVTAPAFSSIEQYLGRNTDAYYDVLAEVGAGKWSSERDTRSWIRFCLRAHFHQATTMLRRTREIRRLWNKLEIEVERAGLPDRTIYALADAALEYRVRNTTYRNAADISMDLASKDLRLVAKSDLLEARRHVRRGCLERDGARIGAPEACKRSIRGYPGFPRNSANNCPNRNERPRTWVTEQLKSRTAVLGLNNRSDR
jgi:Fic family protein